MCRRMRKIMFRYETKLSIIDVEAMCKGMCKMIFGYKIKPMHKGCMSYA